MEVKIFKAESELEEIPKKIEEIDSIIVARKRALETIDEEISAFEERKRPLEAELEENQSILDAADARVKRIKTNKEYLALQREGDIAKRRKVNIEEQILSLMEKMENRLKGRERLQKSFNDDKGLLEEKKNQLLARSDTLKSSLKGIKRKADKLRKTVDPSLLAKYDKMRQNKKGLVVVPCDNGVCSGCHMHIPPQLFNEIIKGDRLIVCPLCQRILYTSTKSKTK
ncbi:MAG: hypothetical protein J7L53_00515 [Deltaproteobacteria bacterium]|nr:hypothetical protein [Deltaproteobacteria bacterium]